MRQIVRMTYWYHYCNFYKGIDECVNAWLEQHPKVKLISSQFHHDNSFFKGTLYEAILTVETPKKIEDDFDSMLQDEAARKYWHEHIAPLYETKPPQPIWVQRVWRRIFPIVERRKV